jgi:RNA recognition motif-containing protein
LPSDSERGTFRGFGFVTMRPNDAAVAIGELDGCEIDGRIVRVNEAEPRA